MRAVNSFKYLFTSSVRLKLLQKLFYFPQELYFTRELGRAIGVEINAIRRELENLKNAGLIISEPRSNKIYHQANTSSPLFLDLTLIAHKTSGLGGDFHKYTDKLGKLDKIYYNQDFLVARPKDLAASEVDILLVGEVILQELEDLIKTEEVLRSREVNYMVMSNSEFQIRKQKRDPFIVDFFLKEPVLIFGKTVSYAQK